jgi:hypothetical protein
MIPIISISPYLTICSSSSFDSIASKELPVFFLLASKAFEIIESNLSSTSGSGEKLFEG